MTKNQRLALDEACDKITDHLPSVALLAVGRAFRRRLALAARAHKQREIDSFSKAAKLVEDAAYDDTVL